MAGIAVEGQNVSGVTLMLQQGMTVSGKIVLEGTTLAPPPLNRLRVNLAAPPGEVNLGVGAATVDTGGQFTITGVTPGRNRLTATVPGGGARQQAVCLARGLCGARAAEGVEPPRGGDARGIWRVRRGRAQSGAGFRRIGRDPLAACQRSHQEALSGQTDFFGGGAVDAPSVMLPNIEEWLPQERLQREYDAVGFFLSGHPLDDYAVVSKRLRVQSWSEFSRAVPAPARPRARLPLPSFRAWNAAPRPATRWASWACPIPRAISRRCCSPKVSRNSAISWEPGAAVLDATRRGVAGRGCARAHSQCRAARPLLPPKPRWA